MNHARFLQFFIICLWPLVVLCFTDDVHANNENTAVDSMNFPKFDGRIVNGTKAELGKFPHQVSLRRSYSNQHFCGGSVIAANWILTAAHCVANAFGNKIPAASVTVVAGQIVLGPLQSHAQKRAAGSIIVHPDYDASDLISDIALIWMKTPLKFNTRSIQPAKLTEKMPKPGQLCQVSGWGHEVENGTVSKSLMFVSLPLISIDRCRQLLINVTDMTLGKFCAGYVNGAMDACQGDSGGGMMCNNTLTGVVSGGEGCARPKLPGYYADVPYFNNWIKNEMKNFNSTHPNSTSEHPTRKPWKTTGNDGSKNFYWSFSLYSIIIAYSMLNYFSGLIYEQ